MDGITYFNIGIKHLARMLVSIYTLRRTWTGEIEIQDAGGSNGIAGRIARQFDCRLRKINVALRRRNTAYCAKANLWRSSSFDETILLDADTVVDTTETELRSLMNFPMLVTRFSDWRTDIGLVRGRLEKWLPVLEGKELGGALYACLDRPYPAINTGVVGWHLKRNLNILSNWSKLCDIGWKCPFTDELAMQILCASYPIHCVSDAWNCSPIYGKSRDPKIWHFHGLKHVRRPDGAGSQGEPLWLPHFRHCWEENLAGVRDWAPAQDGRLGQRMKELGMI